MFLLQKGIFFLFQKNSVIILSIIYEFLQYRVIFIGFKMENIVDSNFKEKYNECMSICLYESVR